MKNKSNAVNKRYLNRYLNMDSGYLLCVPISLTKKNFIYSLKFIFKSELRNLMQYIDSRKTKYMTKQ